MCVKWGYRFKYRYSFNVYLFGFRKYLVGVINYLGFGDVRDLYFNKREGVNVVVDFIYFLVIY